MADQDRAEQQRVLNIQRLAEAMQLLYQTYIIDPALAELRGVAVRAINSMIVALGGESTVEKIEAVPWSRRMRESGEADLVALQQSVAKDMGGKDD